MSFKIEHPFRWICVGWGGAALLLVGVYLASLSPAFPPNDSPETIAAAFSLGIQHPPGYPLPTLLGRLSVLGLGLGSAAWRMNLLSALLALSAVALAGALAWRLSPGAKALAALAAGMGLGLWPPFWEQATEAKGGIYLLNLALGLGLWHAALSAAEGSRKAWRGGLLLSGLILAAHFLSAAPWLVVVGAWMAWAWKRGPLRVRASDFALLLPGAALYLYLPLRARLDPALDLGHPADWGQFVWMLSRAGYGAGPDLSAGLIGDQLRVLGQAMARDGWGLGLLVLGALGWAGLRTRSAGWALGTALLVAVLAGAVLNSTPADNRWLVLIFTLPFVALLAPLAGAGLGGLLQARPRLGVWLALLLGLGAVFWFRAAPRLDRSGSFAAWDYARDLSLSLPRGALYLPEGDYHALPFMHLQAVEGKRADVALLLPVLAGQPWYQALQSRRHGDLLHGPVGDDMGAARALAQAEAGRRPVMLGAFAGGLTRETLPSLQLRQHGLAREAASGFGAPPADHASAWAGRAPARAEADWEPVEASLLPWYTVSLVAAGNEAMLQRRLPEALLSYRQALQRPGAKPSAGIGVNLARAWELAGSELNARRAYEAALAADPGFQPAKDGLAALQARAQGSVAEMLRRADRLAAAGTDDRRALALYEQALAGGYRSAGLWRNIGVIFLRNGDRAQAARAFEQGLLLQPGDKTLLEYLGAAQAR